MANDDTVVVNKTKQEQSLLFVANLAQVAPDNAKKVVAHLTEQGTRSVSVANVTAEAVTANINNHLSGGTIGGDLYIGENSLVGIAYSRMNSDFKFKGSQALVTNYRQKAILFLYTVNNNLVTALYYKKYFQQVTVKSTKRT